MVTMISSIVLSVVILSLTVNVNSQTCNNAAQYSACSSNSGCACLSYSFSNTMGVCGLVTESCSLFATCQSGDTCTQTGYICVQHPRCSASPICYPSTSFDQNACPPVIASNYTGELDVNDGRYIRPAGSSSNYYYEAIRIVVDRTGTYNLTSFAPNNMDTLGYLYNDTFYPQSPSVNLIRQDDDSGGNNQFRLPVFLEAGVPYTLVVTSHGQLITGSYSVGASGPGDAQMTRIDPFYLTTTVITTTVPPIIMSNYSNVLTVNNGNYTRYGVSGTYYYHAIEVRVPTTGTYIFRTSSTISDTYGYLYQGNFYPTYPQYNIVASDDDTSGNRQFGITATLRSDITYILVFTTYTQIATGSFDVTVSGPSNVYMYPINV